MCYAEKAEEAQQHPRTQTMINTAEDKCKETRGPSETKPSAITIIPRKRHNTHTHSYTPVALCT